MVIDKKLSARFITGIFLFIASTIVFGIIAHEIVKENDERLDDNIFNFFAAHTTPEVVQLMRGLSIFGSHQFLIPAHLIILGVLLTQRRWRDAIVTTLMALGGLLSMLALKNYFHRDRPQIKLVEVVQSFSFPSGHTLSSFVFAAVLIFLLWENKWPRRRKMFVFILLLLFSFFVGLSRIVLRVHYATDVMAGFCAGISLVIFALWVDKFIVRPLIKKPKQFTEEE
jgi:undecaprenyl-diphosphatase